VGECNQLEVFFVIAEFAFVANRRQNEDKDELPTSKLDKIFRVAYPSAFIVFLLGYCVIY
jgi:hypothetical protein